MNEGDNCWICEGWVEEEFLLSAIECVNEDLDTEFFLHLEIDDYKACKMNR